MAWNEELDNPAEDMRSDLSSVVLFENTHDKNGWNNKRVAKGISGGVCACDFSRDGLLVRVTTLRDGDVTLETPTLEPWKVDLVDEQSSLPPVLDELDEGDEDAESEEEDAEPPQQSMTSDPKEVKGGEEEEEEEEEENPEHIVDWATQRSFCGRHMRYAWQDPTSYSSADEDAATSSSSSSSPSSSPPSFSFPSSSSAGISPRVDGVTVAEGSPQASDSDLPQLIATGHRRSAPSGRAPCDLQGVGQSTAQLSRRQSQVCAFFPTTTTITSGWWGVPATKVA